MKTQTTWNAQKYQAAAGFVANELGSDLLTWLGPENLRRKTLLDLGCGDGELTEKLMSYSADVYALDSSPQMVEAARARKLKVQLADIESPLPVSDVDVVFTNAVLHWVKDKNQVVHNVRQVLKPGGIFTGEFGGAGCVKKVRTALQQAYEAMGHAGELKFPWYFIADEEFKRLMERNKFKVEQVFLFEKKPVLPEGLVGWLETFGSAIASDLNPVEKRELWSRTAELAAPSLFKNGQWQADYVRLRFKAVAV